MTLTYGELAAGLDERTQAYVASFNVPVEITDLHGRVADVLAGCEAQTERHGGLTPVTLRQAAADLAGLADELDGLVASDGLTPPENPVTVEEFLRVIDGVYAR